jgi:rSAM/selenodomain-associated transferase 2
MEAVEPKISVVIPTLNEGSNISRCLQSIGTAREIEKIVVDGGSRDRTVEIARSLGANVLVMPPGRARQMNVGAENSQGEILLFLHADTVLPAEFPFWIRKILAQPKVAAGAFSFRLDASSPGLKLIEWVANWRSRILQVPYGDQGLFVRSSLFREVGGFRDMPIMEDFEFIRRLRQKGSIRTVPVPAITSARRWQEVGIWRTTLLNQAIVLAYWAGVPPARLACWYRKRRRG